MTDRAPKSQEETRGTGPVSTAFPYKIWEPPMDRGPVFVFAAVVAVIGVLAASSVYVTERNDATMKSVGIQPAPAGQHR